MCSISSPYVCVEYTRMVEHCLKHTIQFAVRFHFPPVSNQNDGLPTTAAKKLIY